MIYSADNQDTETCHEKKVIDGSDRELRNNIWPSSSSLWMAAFYLALVILRPWEILFPWMNAYFPFQKTYALLMLGVIVFSARTRFLMTMQTFTGLLFISALALTSLVAREPSLAWEPYYDYLTVVFIYFILISVIRTPYDIAFMSLCYIGIMAIYLTKSLWEFFIYGHVQFTMDVVRLIGIEHLYGSPNGLAASIVHSLPILFFLWMTRDKISACWPGIYKKLLPLFLIFYFCLGVTSIILTNSRAGFVCMFFFLILLFLRVKSLSGKIGFLIISLLICLVVWTMIPESNQGRFKTIWDPDSGPQSAQQSAQGRFDGFKAGVKIFQQFPITGVGLGGFREYRKEFIDNSSLKAHNLAGELLGTTGILGTVTFAFMVLTVLSTSRKTRKLSADSDDPTQQTLHVMSQAIRMMIFLLLFQGLFSHNMLRFNWLLAAAFSCLSLHFAQQYFEKKNEPAEPGL